MLEQLLEPIQVMVVAMEVQVQQHVVVEAEALEAMLVMAVMEVSMDMAQEAVVV